MAPQMATGPRQQPQQKVNVPKPDVKPEQEKSVSVNTVKESIQQYKKLQALLKESLKTMKSSNASPLEQKSQMDSLKSGIKALGKMKEMMQTAVKTNGQGVSEADMKKMAAVVANKVGGAAIKAGISPQQAKQIMDNAVK